MAVKDPATAAAEAAAKELVKVAYGDLLQPAARLVGEELGEFVRAIVVAGRGFGHLIRDTYEPLVLRALERIPEERRISPPPPLLGRILEGVSYEPPNTPIYEMFEELLTKSMDSNTSSDAHPAFPGFIQQLSPDEVRILRYLWDNKIYGYESTDSNVGWDVKAVDRIGIDSSLVQFANNSLMYIEHLVSMGILRLNHIDSSHSDGKAGEKERFIEITLSELGRIFVDATRRRA